jgi:hypothetical protein
MLHEPQLGDTRLVESRSEPQPSLGLLAGEFVVVRHEQEILATLDESGRLDGLPFMPEMLRYCGARLRVARRAHKTCDTIESYVNRRMRNAVHLEGVNCDGSGHDGCGARCTVFWKEAWLKRDVTEPPRLLARGRSSVLRERPQSATKGSGCTRSDLLENATYVDADGGKRFVCQATELRSATSPLRRRDWEPYLHDLASGNVGLGVMLRTTFFALVRKTFRIGPGFRLKRKTYQVLQKLFNGPPIAFQFGELEKTPSTRLNLSPGELVRVKPYSEIVKTLSKGQRNKGMWFDDEMLPYCGHSYRVLSRVEKIVDEKNGKMLPIKNDCIILDGVVCRAQCSPGRLLCPRQLYPFWREIWLERVD